MDEREWDLLTLYPYIVLDLLEGSRKTVVCRSHCIATFWGQCQSRLLGGLPVRDWLFITLMIVGFIHVILADWKAPSSIPSAGTLFAVIEGQKCAHNKSVGGVGRYGVLWSNFIVLQALLLMQGGSSVFVAPPGLGFHLAFTSVTAAVVAAGVDLQKVFVGASRANQHIYLMTRALLLVRMDYLHFGHDRHHR